MRRVVLPFVVSLSLVGAFSFGSVPNSLAGAAISNSLAHHAKVPVPGAPTNVQAVAISRTITLSWKAPVGAKGPLTYTATSTTPPASCVTTATKCTMKNLTNGLTYTFTVIAKNAGGFGQASDPSNGATPATIPQPPTTVVVYPGPAQATVSWTAPTDNGGSPITSYTVTSTPEAKTCTTATTTCAVTGLTNGKAYTFTVVAYSGVGKSLASIPSSKSTPLASYSICSSVAPNTNYVGVNFSNCNLAGLDLSNDNLKNASFINANLSGVKLTGAILTGAKFSGANLAGVTSGNVTLDGVSGLPTGWKFSNGYLFGPQANLAGATIFGASLDKVNLSGAYLKGINIQNSTLTSTNFSGANLQNAQIGTNWCSNLDLSGSNFSGADLTGAVFGDGGCDRSNFSNTNFTNAVMARTAIRGVLDGAISGGITGARGLIGYGYGTANPNNPITSGPISVYNGYLFGAGANDAGVNFAGDSFGTNPDLSNTILTGASFNGVTLNGASFVNSVLDGADFTGATLQGSNFTNANLNATVFGSAAISSGTFTSAILTNVVFTGASWTANNFTQSQLIKVDVTSSDLSTDSFSSSTYSTGIVGGDTVLLPAGWSVVLGALRYNA